MKKYVKCKNVLVLLTILAFLNMLVGCSNDNLSKNLVANKSLNNEKTNNDGLRTLDYDEVKDSLIRFHVIANSDSEEDQNLKIKVKNSIIEYLYPYLNQSESLDESREIIKSKMSEVKKIAENVIDENNYSYSVKTQLSRENFPDKSYGNIVLPQGNYEAFRIIIGSGEGKNWWCVMFPPLCFVDESKAEVEYDKVEEKIKAQKQEKCDDESKEEDNVKTDDVQIKFKSIEILENLFK